MPSDEHAPHDESSFEITSQGDHALVRQRGRLADLSEARELQTAVLHRCSEWGVRRVLFDNRESAAPDESVRDDMWSWISEVDLERVGLLLTSPMGAVRANMTALSKGVKVRAFGELNEALSWLRS